MIFFDNHIADALSRITITDLKNIQTNNKILTVTTRNQSKQKNSSAGKEKPGKENYVADALSRTKIENINQ